MNKLKYFTAKWCGPCRFFRPTIDELIKEGSNIEIIDIDEDSNQSKAYDVMAVPTLIFENSSGTTYARTSGVIPKDSIKDALAFTPEEG